MSKPIDQLMQKEMDRREFLVTLGFGAASLVGLSSLLHLLGKTPNLSTGSLLGNSPSDSYGSSAYGGRKQLI